MTSDGDALFRAVCEQPGEDTPRLAYADWLEESRPDRAAFIRAEIEAHHLFVVGRPLPTDLVDRRRELMDVRRAWLDELPTPAGVSWGNHFVRGFPSLAVFSTGGRFNAAARTVFGTSPVSWATVRRVPPRSVPRLAGSPYLARLRRLEFERSAIGDEGVAVLLNRARLDALEVLALPDCRITDAGAIGFATAPGLGRLEVLYLSGNAISFPVARAIALSRQLPALRSLLIQLRNRGQARLIEAIMRDRKAAQV